MKTWREKLFETDRSIPMETVDKPEAKVGMDGSKEAESLEIDGQNGSEGDIYERYCLKKEPIEEMPKERLAGEAVIRSVAEQNVRASILPKTGGHWKDSEQAGNSQWILNDEVIITWRQNGDKHSMTGAQLKEKYGIEGVNYIENEPDFEPFEDPVIGHVELEEFSGNRTGKTGTYQKANIAAAGRVDDVEKYMKEHGLVWHECGDRKTMRAIPAELNAAFKHTGGIGVEKSVNAMREYLYEQYGHFTLKRETITAYVSEDDLKNAIAEIRKAFRNKNSRI